ncbi:MAG: hypothetical protein ACE5ID_05080, partial [Acidobacteriota bacterium]
PASSEQHQRLERGLREVVLESSRDRLICRAAFYLASSLRRQHRVDRARVFLRTAQEKASSLGDPVLLARCENLAGNIHLDRGKYRHAARSYQLSLTLWEEMKGDHRFARAIVLDNLGYCLTLKGQVDEGILLIQGALDLSTEIHDRRTEAECRQDLSHAHLCLKKLSPARTHAQIALSIAEQAGFLDIIKNCSYVLGEIAAMEGNLEESDRHFKRLQSYFPAFPHIRPFLHLFDISRLLTFH